MYTISRRDANGKITEEEFRSFPHAVNILLNYIYYPVHLLGLWEALEKTINR